MQIDVEAELREAVERILRSPSRKKLIVAGPGAGKTTIFRKLLESTPGRQKTRLVLTFINNLKDDLSEDLGELASVYTLHGYSQSLLRGFPSLRQGLTGAFRCLPGLASLIKKDWTYLRDADAPLFVENMRELIEGEESTFYLQRGNYYDALDFDDSVFRTFKGLQAADAPKAYDLVLIDEYQDFNHLEAAFIDLLAQTSPIVIAGDDDQALYSQLRGSSWDFIRTLHNCGEYEVFQLPFCMRCPEVIVGAVNDILAYARRLRKLDGRIDKPYRYFHPVKGPDSQRYPRMGLVAASVQRLNANYFGKYIEEAISKIPPEEIQQAEEKGDAAVLVIGAVQYLRQIGQHLEQQGYSLDTKRDRQERLSREAGLDILREDPAANLGWRVILDTEPEDVAREAVCRAAAEARPLVEVIPDDLRQRVLSEVAALKEKPQAPPEEPKREDTSKPIVKLTSFEGAKGLSAQHVFIVGMHEGDLPRDSTNIRDIEICRFVVGLTRAKKQCSLLHAGRFADKPRKPSAFIKWVKPERFEAIRVDAAYWKKPR